MNTLKDEHPKASLTSESQQQLSHWRADVASPYKTKPQNRQRYVIAYEDLYAYGFPIVVGLIGLSLLFVAAIYYGLINP
jgi:hypothetical protein